jgi:hypothetical protein
MKMSDNEHYLWRRAVCEQLCMSPETTVDELFERLNFLLNLETPEWKAPAGFNRGDRKAAISGTDTLLTVGGKKFRCECGANVFSKTLTDGYYRCNGCDAGYESLPA